jgi:hypothetical protein
VTVEGEVEPCHSAEPEKPQRQQRTFDDPHG